MCQRLIRFVLNILTELKFGLTLIFYLFKMLAKNKKILLRRF